MAAQTDANTADARVDDAQGGVDMDPLQKQMLDDVFDAFTMLSDNSIVSLMHVVGGFTRYSRAAVDLFGLPGEYIPNGAMDWNDYLHPDDRKRYMDVMMPLVDGTTQTYDLTYRVRTVSGDYYVFRAVGAVLRGADGSPSLIGGALFNEGMAENTDPVTVLPNRGAFVEALRANVVQGRSVFALRVGLTGFEELNSVYGYTYGNRTLQETAWVIQEVVSDRAAVYRLEGPAFAILADDLTREELAAIYDMISYRLQRGIEVNGRRNILQACGGMVSTFGTEVDAQTVCTCLEYACEDSRTRLHGDLVDFNGSINYDGAESLELVNSIRLSAAQGMGGFTVEYAPVIGVQDEQPNGAEALVCWQDDEHGHVDTADFVPILERDFLFEDISDFVLERSLADGVKLLEADPGFLLCINVYRIQLESDYFVENLLHYLDLTGFPPQQLSLKLDAGCRFVEVERVREVIGALHEHGILAIMDGFGSGSNSIVYLKQLPFDAVSMDTQFIHGVEDSDRDREILEHLARMASACVEHLNIGGIDSAERRETVRGLPFTTLQGTLFSEPLPYDAFRAKYYN